MVHPAIIVHGGAGPIPADLRVAHENGCRRAAEAGFRLLLAGGSAEDAVEAAIRVMEDDEVFDAGRGSFLNLDGVVELDAAFMEGANLRAGAVAGVHDIANPITLARLVMASPHVFLVGEGASHFGVEHGLVRCSVERLVVPREIEFWQRAHREGLARARGASDTVGAVALDGRAHLACGNSTGGIPFKWPGRVGDVPCVGAGLYADDTLGAASSTGEGEAIMRIVMAKRAIDHLAAGQGPQQAAAEAIDYLCARVQGHGGLIMLDARGRVGAAFSTPFMPRAWNEGSEILSAL
jgi:L-asparaginase / beta-aspartyl-peptidase